MKQFFKAEISRDKEGKFAGFKIPLWKKIIAWIGTLFILLWIILVAMGGVYLLIKFIKFAWGTW
jgi:hypothetical protein